MVSEQVFFVLKTLGGLIERFSVIEYRKSPDFMNITT